MPLEPHLRRVHQAPAEGEAGPRLGAVLFGALRDSDREVVRVRLEGDQARAYVLAGRGRFTLVSKRTEGRFTYRVSAAPGGHALFVALLTGPNNEANYTFIGTIFTNESVFVPGKKSRIGSDAPGVRAFGWAWKRLAVGRCPEQLEVHHEGACGKCGRPLTTPESIATGFGPVCLEAKS